MDYGLFLMARHREQVDGGMDIVTSARLAAGTSGAAIVVAGSTVSVSILGLYIAGVAFVGSLGLAAAIVVAVTMLAALTLVPALMGVVRGNVRPCLRASVPARPGYRCRSRRLADRHGHAEQHETARSPAGGGR